MWSYEVQKLGCNIFPCTAIYYYDRDHIKIKDELFSYSTQQFANINYFNNFNLSYFLRQILKFLISNNRQYFRLQYITMHKIIQDFKMFIYKKNISTEIKKNLKLF
jgi:hypothetical protein